jgi:aspartate ammonia-lyase
MLEPVIGLNILQSTRMLTRGMEILKQRCIDGIAVDLDRCKILLDQFPVLATPLARRVGYSKAAYLSKKALAGKGSCAKVSKKKIDQLFAGSAGFSDFSSSSST